jgi:GNAT superfamily N-acetyltransferase
VVGPARDSDLPSSFELWAVYIEPMFQLQGYGRALIEYAIELARARNYSHVILWVFKLNEASRSFYEGMGFSAEGKTDVIDFLDQKILRYHRKL